LAKSDWQHAGTALLDFEDGRAACANGTAPMNTALRDTVAAGDYTGVAFKAGVPFEMNHGDPTTAPSPLNLTSMFWNWRGGYKFVRIDMVPTDRRERAGSCTLGPPCAHPKVRPMPPRLRARTPT
jgi:uncharacterized repeat protein (TIGR04052 family)